MAQVVTVPRLATEMVVVDSSAAAVPLIPARQVLEIRLPVVASALMQKADLGVVVATVAAAAGVVVGTRVVVEATVVVVGAALSDPMQKMSTSVPHMKDTGVAPFVGNQQARQAQSLLLPLCTHL